MKSILSFHDLEQMKQLLRPFFLQNFHQLTPFDPKTLSFCENLSEALFKMKEINEHPDLAALAFWLRGAHLNQLQQMFIKNINSQRKISPRGLVFHFPPGNIEVMLVYSWITALLAGNGSIIRIPSNPSERFIKLLQLIFRLLSQEQYSKIDQINCFVQYGHEEALTAWISSQVDVRLIWGGNESVEAIRKIPLKAHANDLSFPDRFSYAAISAAVYLKTTPEEKETAARYFFNDAYWFDQSACSSPRLIFWIGDDKTIVSASNLFYEALQRYISQRNYETTLGGALLKKTYLFNQALALPVQTIHQFSNELSVVYLDKVDKGCRVHCGQGLFYHIPIKDLNEIADFAATDDQTLTYYGIDADKLEQLVSLLNGRGLTRIVPFGQALNFDTIWDGKDLLMELIQNTLIVHRDKA